MDEHIDRLTPTITIAYWCALAVAALALATVLHEAGHVVPGAIFRVFASDPRADWGAFPLWQQVVTSLGGMVATFGTVAVCALLVSRSSEGSSPLRRDLTIATGAVAVARGVPVLLLLAIPYATGRLRSANFDEFDIFRGDKVAIMTLLAVEVVLFAVTVRAFSEKIARPHRAAATFGLVVGGAVALLAVVLIDPSV